MELNFFLLKDTEELAQDYALINALSRKAQLPQLRCLDVFI